MINDLDVTGVTNINVVLTNATFTGSNAVTYTHPYAPRHDFNAMDCTDIVIGSARGTTSRIWDYYTRDRLLIKK
jgi:hypothetical protein